MLQRGVVGLLRIESERGRWRTCLDELGLLAADAFDLARPDGLARATASRPASNSANLMLDEPQLSTRMGSAAGPGAGVPLVRPLASGGAVSCNTAAFMVKPRARPAAPPLRNASATPKDDATDAPAGRARAERPRTGRDQREPRTTRCALRASPPGS
jgi:hypothetical protein